MKKNGLDDDLGKICYWSGDCTSKAILIQLDTLDRFGFKTKKEVYVKPEFEDDLRSFNNCLKKYGRTFIGLILIISVLLMTAPFTALATRYSENVVLDITGVLIVLFGLAIIALPFPTPETIKWMGTRQAVNMTRVLGIVTFLFGIVIWIV